MSKKAIEESKFQKKNTEKNNCKNCDTQFKGKFCPNCGQSVYEFDKPFKFLIADLAGNIFAFDTRFWKSLVSLIIRPGKFTTDYINGHRARYMPPFRLYVFVSFIFFLLLSVYVNKKTEITKEQKTTINKQLDASVDSVDASNTKDIQLTQKKQTQNPELNNNSDSSADNESIIDLSFQFDNNNIANVIKMTINNPSIYINSFLKFISWSLFFLMPVYAGLLWLFFYKSKTYFFSHLIFAINQHTFAFILFSLMLLFSLIFPNRNYYYELYLALLIPIYMYIGYCKLYKQKYYRTLYKLFSIAVLYMLVFAIALGIILVYWVKSIA